MRRTYGVFTVLISVSSYMDQNCKRNDKNMLTSNRNDGSGVRAELVRNNHFQLNKSFNQTPRKGRGFALSFKKTVKCM